MDSKLFALSKKIKIAFPLRQVNPVKSYQKLDHNYQISPSFYLKLRIDNRNSSKTLK